METPPKPTTTNTSSSKQSHGGHRPRRNHHNNNNSSAQFFTFTYQCAGDTVASRPSDPIPHMIAHNLRALTKCGLILWMSVHHVLVNSPDMIYMLPKALSGIMWLARPTSKRHVKNVLTLDCAFLMQLRSIPCSKPEDYCAVLLQSRPMCPQVCLDYGTPPTIAQFLGRFVDDVEFAKCRQLAINSSYTNMPLVYHPHERELAEIVCNDGIRLVAEFGGTWARVGVIEPVFVRDATCERMRHAIYPAVGLYDNDNDEDDCRDDGLRRVERSGRLLIENDAIRERILSHMEAMRLGTCEADDCESVTEESFPKSDGIPMCAK